jgi:hypothetical protein
MKKFSCELVSWEKTYKLAKLLARQIKLSSYKPELVIAIGRGGFTPARVICDFLAIKDLTSIKVEHWGSAELKGKVKLYFPISREIVQNKKVLIVDDITDTGDTLARALEHIKAYKPKAVRVAVLQHKVVSHFIPDYFVEKITKWRWIIYPWAIYEDFSKFIVKVIGGKKLTSNQILLGLKKKFNTTISLRALEWILEELELDNKIKSSFRRNKKYYSAR